MKKIVILEYSGSAEKNICLDIEKLEVKIITSSKGIDGLKIIYKEKPNLVIIDSILEDISGVVVLEYIKRDKFLKNIPVIIYSTIIDKSSELFFSNADVFLKKDPDLYKNLEKYSRQFLSKSKNSEDKGIEISESEIKKNIELIYANRKQIDKMTEEILSISASFDTFEVTLKKIADFLISNFNELESDNLKFMNPIIKKILEHAYIYQSNVRTASKLKALFTNFLPEKVINSLLKKQTDKSLMTGEKREIAVIFSHLRDFSIIEKNNNAEDVVNFLNTHFTGLSAQIKKNGGEINKFIGDAVFAMFGAPESYEDNEKRAGCSAMDMINFINNNKPDFIKFSSIGYRIGIGIHIGKAIIGNIGSSDNFDYTAIGDTINLAARLESLNKYYDTDILVSEEIKNGCRRYQNELTFREVDTVMVKGKDKPTTIFSLEDIKRLPESFIDNYNKGLKMFKLSNWYLALDYFLNCINILSSDKIVQIYIERCKTFITNPPDNWNGAITLGFK